jgi:hypothetical protein
MTNVADVHVTGGNLIYFVSCYILHFYSKKGIIQNSVENKNDSKYKKSDLCSSVLNCLIVIVSERHSLGFRSVFSV